MMALTEWGRGFLAGTLCGVSLLLVLLIAALAMVEAMHARGDR